MISIWMVAAFLAQQAPAPVAAAPRVEGRVINSTSGEGVPKATVILRAHDVEHGQSYADETDGNGNFSIGDVEPGEYAVIAERAGFVVQSSGATGAPPPHIKVAKDQQVKDVTIRLTPLGVITGRVLDSDGEPVRGARIFALRYAYSAGRKELRNVSQVQSGDHGDFRLFGLPAGTLYLKAVRSRQSPKGQVLNVSAYYPGVDDESHAAPIELRAGAQLQGFDIRLQTAGAYSIRFKLADGHPQEGCCNAFLANEQGIQQTRGMNVSTTELVFAGVPSGSYEAVVSVPDGEKQDYAIQHIELLNADVDGGTLTFLPAVEVAGSVRVEGGAFADLAMLQINLESPHRIPIGNHTGEVNPDGSFLLKDAIPGVYEVAINRIRGVYLKSVRMGDKLLADRRLDLTSKIEPLTVLLGADAGEVEGSVQNARGDAVARARVSVIAYGDQASRADFYRTGFSDEKGDFKIKDVPPGEYKVFAWEDVPVGAPQDPEFRKPFEKQSAPLRMQPRGHEKVSVTAIPASATKGGDQ
jgi:Carboxypeptidase regulatory-like domain